MRFGAPTHENFKDKSETIAFLLALISILHAEHLPFISQMKNVFFPLVKRDYQLRYRNSQ